jgi:hypothetical protein
MDAGHFLQTWELRKDGYEHGFLKYPPDLYEAVCALVEALSRLPSDEEIRVDFEVQDALFVVARTGLPIAETSPSAK